jgi:hypothetical protein
MQVRPKHRRPDLEVNGHSLCRRRCLGAVGPVERAEVCSESVQGVGHRSDKRSSEGDRGVGGGGGLCGSSLRRP